MDVGRKLNEEKTSTANPDAFARRLLSAILATCFGGCLIGLAPIFVRFSEIGPSFTGFYRFVFATILILIYGLISGKLKFLKFRELLIVAIPGLCFGIDITFWHSSITMTSVANATLFINTAPLYVCLFALIILSVLINNFISINQ